jgi:hypothetical protein
MERRCWIKIQSKVLSTCSLLPQSMAGHICQTFSQNKSYQLIRYMAVRHQIQSKVLSTCSLLPQSMAGHTCQTFCRTSPTNCDDSIHGSAPSNCDDSIHGSSPKSYNCDDSIHGSSPSNCDDSIHGSSPSTVVAKLSTRLRCRRGCEIAFDIGWLSLTARR